MQDHAFNTCVEPVDSTPATGSLGDHSAAPFTWASACRIHAPIVFGIRVLTETLSQCDCARLKHGVRRWNIQPMAIGIPSGIARVFDGKWMRQIVLAIRQSLQAENPVGAGAIETAA
jgi:hypothetical protein